MLLVVLHYKNLFWKKQWVAIVVPIFGCQQKLLAKQKEGGRNKNDGSEGFKIKAEIFGKGLVVSRLSLPVIRVNSFSAWSFVFVDYVFCLIDVKMWPWWLQTPHVSVISNAKKKGNNQRSAAGSSLHWLHLTNNFLSHSKPPFFQRRVAWKATNALSTMMAYWQNNYKFHDYTRVKVGCLALMELDPKQTSYEAFFFVATNHLFVIWPHFSSKIVLEPSLRSWVVLHSEFWIVQAETLRHPKSESFFQKTEAVSWRDLYGFTWRKGTWELLLLSCWATLLKKGRVL